MAVAELDDILADGLLTVEEAMDYLRVSRGSCYNAMNRGDLPYIQLPGQRSRRIPKSAVVEFARRGLVQKQD